ncbi:glycosyltransferase family 2 protein [Pedobacter heparinus]|uniref:glycosyltransferase family 2 protein n=1 Tax=Pedobacter heparinus TaxID=984 RepID=UPI00292E3F73|nr:glycosyltransferase family 2 protein [Pedobacter heparinus]
MTNTAPIILFVYNRVLHTQQVIAALRKNFLSQESELYIYADAAKDSDALDKVNQLRSYLPTITGFKNVHIYLRETNLGVDENTIQGVTEVINIHGKAIVLEDDLVTSPWFLKFMNEALEFYENQHDVAAIHGYVYPVQQKLKEVFFLKGADCWGWATWRRAWNLFEHDGMKLLNRIIAQGLQKEFDFNNTYPYFKALKEQAIGNTTHWDIRWYASAFLAEKLTLYPGQSLVTNIGHDTSGTHCGNSTDYDVIMAQSALSVETNIIPDPDAYHAFAEFFKHLSSDKAPRSKGVLSRSFKNLKIFISKLCSAKGSP